MTEHSEKFLTEPRTVRDNKMAVVFMVKNLPAMWETWVQSLGWEDPLEKEIANHSNILAWEIPWTEEPGGLQFMGSQRFRHNRSNLACMHTCGS